MDYLNFDQLYETEKNHWWFKARRDITNFLFLNKIKKNKKLKILSIGVSSGAEIEYLSKYGDVIGIELDSESIKYCKSKNFNVIEADIIKNSFPDESFDIIFARDVLEHIPDHEQALKEIFRILKKDGLVIITVPACQFLWSKHDELGSYPHIRRYDKTSLKNLIKTQNFKILKLSYYNFFLFPLVLLTRKLFRIQPSTQLEIPSKFTNKIFQSIFSSEKYFLKYLNLPIGSSLLSICKK